MVCRGKKKTTKPMPSSIPGWIMEEISACLPKKYDSKAGFAAGIDPTAIKRNRRQEWREIMLESPPQGFSKATELLDLHRAADPSHSSSTRKLDPSRTSS